MVGEGCAGPLYPSMRIFHASHANRSASLRAFFARSADMAIEAPYSDCRDLVDTPHDPENSVESEAARTWGWGYARHSAWCRI
jgi:hypothetical protein